MAQKKIIQKGDPVLLKKSHPVSQFDKKLHRLIDDMRATLDAARGAGLAAAQIGILRRVVLVMDENENYIELVNPEIIATEGEQDGLEGCLSLSGLYGYVKRPAKVTVRAQDRFGQWFEKTGEGMMARCFCHELEHLEGQLFDRYTDKLYTEAQIEALSEEREAAE